MNSDDRIYLTYEGGCDTINRFKPRHIIVFVPRQNLDYQRHMSLSHTFCGQWDKERDKY